MGRYKEIKNQERTNILEYFLKMSVLNLEKANKYADSFDLSFEIIPVYNGSGAIIDFKYKVNTPIL